MSLFLSETELTLVGALSGGISKALVYRVGLYPVAVSLRTADGRWLTLHASQKDIAERFELFPIAVYEGDPSNDPDQELSLQEFEQGCTVSILQKTEWDIPTAEDDRGRSAGDKMASTTQYEGESSQVPDNALHTAALHAGIELHAPQGSRFLVATSMSP